MATLPKFTLQKDERRDDWTLRRGSSNELMKRFGTKADATKGGALKRAIGGEGSVEIQKENGGIQEERTFPRSKDPRSSKG